MWSNLDKSDKNFLGFSILIGLLLIIVLIILLNPSGRSLINIVGVVGSIVTVIALIFSIHQQSKLRKTAEEIKKATDNVYHSLKKDIDGWNYSKAIEITTEIENSFIANDFRSIRPLYKFLLDILEDNKRIYFVDFDRKIRAWLKQNSALSNVDYENLRAKESTMQRDNLKKAIKGCNRQYIDICKLINEEQNQSQTNLTIDCILNLRTELTKCKPTFLTDL